MLTSFPPSPRIQNSYCTVNHLSSRKDRAFNRTFADSFTKKVRLKNSYFFLFLLTQRVFGLLTSHTHTPPKNWQALIWLYTPPSMSFCYTKSPLTNREYLLLTNRTCSFPCVRLQQFHDISFLLWRATTTYYCWTAAC